MFYIYVNHLHFIFYPDYEKKYVDQYKNGVFLTEKVGNF